MRRGGFTVFSPPCLVMAGKSGGGVLCVRRRMSALSNRTATYWGGRMPDQEKVDRENAAFWNELCGSWIASQLGIMDSSPASLKKYDDWYMGLYPYLLK